MGFHLFFDNHKHIRVEYITIRSGSDTQHGFRRFGKFKQDDRIKKKTRMHYTALRSSDNKTKHLLQQYETKETTRRKCRPLPPKNQTKQSTPIPLCRMLHRIFNEF